MNGERVLDLYCGGGGAARGYLDAGASLVWGIDIDGGMQDDFLRATGDNGVFLRGDALELLGNRAFLSHFDFIHASPPCQRWSRMSACRPGLSEKYPDLITPTLPLLEASGLPYVIENIVAPGTRKLLPGAVILCGVMFGKPMYRHRLFKAGGWQLAAPPPSRARSRLQPRECGWRHPVPAARAGHWEEGFYVSVSGHERRSVVNSAMGIDWMRDREHVKEAIPPAFTAYAGALYGRLQAVA